MANKTLSLMAASLLYMTTELVMGSRAVVRMQNASYSTPKKSKELPIIKQILDAEKNIAIRG